MLDPKRSNAVGILISRLPSISEIRSAIAALDEAALGREQLEQVLMQMPTAEEEEALKAMDGPDVVWDKPDAFLRMLLSVPRVTSRLRSWSIQRAFEERAAEVEAPLETLRRAYEGLCESEGLRALLATLLAFGKPVHPVCEPLRFMDRARRRLLCAPLGPLFWVLTRCSTPQPSRSSRRSAS